MNMKIKDSIVWTAFLAVMAIIMFPSCSDEHEAGILEITRLFFRRKVIRFRWR